MPVTIEQLNEKYGKEDQYWDFKLFWGWLGKKGIAQDVITATLKKVLADYTIDSLPATHHEFDNSVKDMAFQLKDTAESILTEALNQSVTDGYAKYEEEWNSLSKAKKIWEVLRGRA